MLKRVMVRLIIAIFQESAEQGLILLREAKIYATDRDLLGFIQRFIDLGEKHYKQSSL